MRSVSTVAASHESGEIQACHRNSAFLDKLATLTGRDPRPGKRRSKPGANRGLVKWTAPLD